MKKLFLFSIVLQMSILSASAQKNARPFRAYLYNNEYEVFMRLDLYGESITIPGQELYGEVPGYLGKKHNSFCWLITSSKIDNDKAELQMINDYGSEDLTATLTVENDSLYVLRQVEGSTLKVPKEGKWQKLPTKLVFKRRH
jgi:hypothetical protein